MNVSWNFDHDKCISLLFLVSKVLLLLLFLFLFLFSCLILLPPHIWKVSWRAGWCHFLLGMLSLLSFLFYSFYSFFIIIALVLWIIAVETTLPIPPHTPYTHKMKKILKKKSSGMFCFSAYGSKSPAAPSPTLIDWLFCLYIKARMSQIFPCEFHLLVMSSANPY